MTYTFKLARRLAVSKATRMSGVAAFVVLTGCTAESSNQTEPPPPEAPITLTSVVLLPDTVSLTPGATQQFTVTGVYNDGSSSDEVGVIWTSTGGFITPEGLYTADNALGEFRVVGTRPGGALADTAVVMIAEEGEEEPPPPSGSDLVNECTNADPAWIWCDDFEVDRLAEYFEYDDEGGSFVRAAGVGVEGSNAMRAHFDAGQVGAGALHLAFGKTPDSYFSPVDEGTAVYREIYWRVYLRNQDGWTGGGGFKLSRATSFASSTWAQAMIAHVWSGGESTTWDHLVLDPASGTDESGNLRTTAYNDFPNLRWLGATQGTTPVFGSGEVGAWHCIEAHVRLNGSGTSDGVFELWIDGELDASHTGLNWVGSFSEYGINAVFFENYWNGGSPTAQERYFDNVVVSTERIGC